MDHEFLTTDEAVVFLRFHSKHQLYNLLRSRQQNGIPVLRVNRKHLLFKKQDLVAWLESHRNASG